MASTAFVIASIAVASIASTASVNAVVAVAIVASTDVVLLLAILDMW